MPPAPEVNHFVPFFKVVDSKGKLISPDLLLGHPYILYFYPKDDTPGCMNQACQFRNAQSTFDLLKTPVIGISPDGQQSHERFIHKHQLPFSLIADTNYELCSLFKVWEQKKMAGKTFMGVVRTTFVVDARGVIRWIEKPVNVAGHCERVLEAIKQLPPTQESFV